MKTKITVLLIAMAFLLSACSMAAAQDTDINVQDQGGGDNYLPIVVTQDPNVTIIYVAPDGDDNEGGGVAVGNRVIT